MKFDKFMNFCFKGLCLCLACFILAGFCVSCFHSPVTACADSVDPVFMAQQADNYRNQLEQNLQAIESAVLTDIKNGNLDATSALGRQYLQAVAIQAACLNSPTFQAIYRSANLVLDGIPDDLFYNPSQITIENSGGTGFYYDYLGELHQTFVQESVGGGVVAYSDQISITISFQDTVLNADTSPISVSGASGFEYTGTLTSAMVKYDDTLDYLSDIGTTFRFPRQKDFVIRYDNSVIPTFNRGITATNFYCGLGVSYTLNSQSIDSDKPWTYYNNTVLPYINDTLPDVPDSIIVFPYGWNVVEPTEPATMPNGGIYIDKQFNIGINIITPTDGNGQPVTDASGETVTETVYVTETYPPDGDYRFQLPTLDTLTMYQATVPNPDISSFTGGFAFIWNCVDHFFNDTGFMPVVIACLSMSVLAYVLWKVGG